MRLAKMGSGLVKYGEICALQHLTSEAGVMSSQRRWWRLDVTTRLDGCGVLSEGRTTRREVASADTAA
jgi:hypothetical protein